MLNIYCNPNKETTTISDAKAYDTIFSLYREDIVKLLKQQWLQEDINGTSNVQAKVSNYFLVYLYVMMLRKDYNSGLYTNQELKDKYKVDEYDKCFACHGISLDKLLELLEIDLTSLGCTGINTLGIAYNWQLSNANCLDYSIQGTIEKVDVLSLLEPSTCQILLTSEC